jgi:hypothetical protein
MGANFLIAAATVILQSSPDSTARSSPSPPADTVTHGGFAFERLSDLFQYNRVQGVSVGVGYRVPLPGPFTAAYATLRYGMSDDRVTGRFSVVHDAPGWQLTVSGYHDVADVDPFSPGRTFSNTFDALFAGHDNGDYVLAGGGSAVLETSVGTRLDLRLGARLERQSGPRAVAESEVNDFLGGTGVFPPNWPARERTFGIGWARLSGLGRLRWNVTVDVLGGAGQVRPRLFGDIRWHAGWRRGITVQLKAGAGPEPALPQTLFRLGGLNTVRGFEYGSERGPAFWAGQVDVAPLGGKVRPVIFLDAGQAGAISDLVGSTALIGGGVGLSLLKGLLRFDLSRAISPDSNRKLRFDIVIQGVR